MASEMYLQLDGIEGETSDQKHAGCIEIGSWSVTYAQPAAETKAATGPSIEKVACEGLEITKIMDASTPPLLKKIWGGKVIKEGHIWCYRADDENAPIKYLDITMMHIIVAGYGISGGEGALPEETITLAPGFTKFEYTQQPHVADGSPGSVVAELDMIQNMIA